MDKLKQVLKDKIKQLPADKQAKAAYLSAEQVRKFLEDTRSIAAFAANAADAAYAAVYAAGAFANSAYSYADSAAAAAAYAAYAAYADAAYAAYAANAAELSEDAILDKNVVEVCKLQDDVEDVFKVTGTTKSATILGMQAVMTEQDKHVGLTIQANNDNEITNLYFSDTGDNKLSNDVVKRIAVILCKLKGLGEREQLSFLDECIKVIDELQKNGDK
jgi:hypothetical protein